jgi:hypothetical protein
MESPFWMFQMLNVVGWLFGYGIDEAHFDWETQKFIDPWSNILLFPVLVMSWHWFSYEVLCIWEIGSSRGAIILLIGTILVIMCHAMIIEFALYDGMEKISCWILIYVEIIYIVETLWFLFVAANAVGESECEVSTLPIHGANYSKSNESTRLTASLTHQTGEKIHTRYSLLEAQKESTIAVV